MKLLNRNIDKDGKGTVTLVPEEDEDIWHAYNLVSRGDSLKCSTFRKINTESSTGTSNSYKVTTMLTLRVEEIDYDTAGCVLRVKGKNIVQNDYVKLGQYHTLELELNRKFTLWKYCWDSVAMERLNEVCEPSKRAELVGVVMQQGLAYVCLITNAMTIVKAKIEVQIPRKRRNACAAHEKALLKFYDSIIAAIRRHADFNVVKCVLIASPGFVREHFFAYMMERATKEEMKDLTENRTKFLLAHSSSGHKYSLREVLCDPIVVSKLTDTKAASEVKIMESFYEMLQTQQERAFYGWSHVYKAHYVYEAVEKLLISDKLFRSKTLRQRKRYVQLVDDVRGAGAQVHVFSSLHVSGEQLDQLGGLAAILKFPVAALEDEDFD